MNVYNISNFMNTQSNPHPIHISLHGYFLVHQCLTAHTKDSNGKWHEELPSLTCNELISVALTVCVCVNLSAHQLVLSPSSQDLWRHNPVASTQKQIDGIIAQMAMDNHTISTWRQKVGTHTHYMHTACKRHTCYAYVHNHTCTHTLTEINPTPALDGDRPHLCRFCNEKNSH